MQREALTVAMMMKRRRTQMRKTIRAWRCGRDAPSALFSALCG